ncbi:hypothetical protein GOODEAATRI_014758 [Goodea atripinnis]|uniref:Uncharacterized protein n=1 Tax=Goodea atripinnis TaxID=208336 RepID=A0ABV0PY25_9TELE
MDDVQNKWDSQLGGEEEEKKGKTAKAKESKSPFSQSREEWRRKGKAIFIQIQLQLEGESSAREAEEENGGGEDVVICLRDYKRCWQSMIAYCVCKHTCMCVYVKSEAIFL